MKIRVFGSQYCDTCINLCKDLKALDTKFDWIDADDDVSQDLCDENEVDFLPHIQILDETAVYFNHAGPMLAADIKLIFDRIKKKKSIRN